MIATEASKARGIIPTVGLHHDIPDAEYRSWDAVNQSLLQVGLDRSMLHLAHERDNPSEPSDAMRLGTAFHAMVLQPDRISDLIAVEPEVNGRTNAGKAERAEFARENAGKTIVTAEQWKRASAMREALMRHPRARWLAEHLGHTETVAVWDQPVRLSGGKIVNVRSKGRIDKLIPGFALWDIKTTRNAAAVPFSRSIYDYGYHRQNGWYETGYRAVTRERLQMVLTAIESEPPYGVACYTLGDRELNIGMIELGDALVKYVDALRSGRWPGYSDDIEPIEFQPWVYQRYGDAV